jgi:hypothetical protein
MYGTTEREDFEKLAGVDKMKDWEITRRRSTILTLTPHAKSHENFPDQRWIEHANLLLEWKRNHPAT